MDLENCSEVSIVADREGDDAWPPMTGKASRTSGGGLSGTNTQFGQVLTIRGRLASGERALSLHSSSESSSSSALSFSTDGSAPVALRAPLQVDVVPVAGSVAV
jgi:hypothetical protein